MLWHTYTAYIIVQLGLFGLFLCFTVLSDKNANLYLEKITKADDQFCFVMLICTLPLITLLFFQIVAAIVKILCTSRKLDFVCCMDMLRMGILNVVELNRSMCGCYVCVCMGVFKLHHSSGMK